MNKSYWRQERRSFSSPPYSRPPLCLGTLSRIRDLLTGKVLLHSSIQNGPATERLRAIRIEVAWSFTPDSSAREEAYPAQASYRASAISHLSQNILYCTTQQPSSPLLFFFPSAFWLCSACFRSFASRSAIRSLYHSPICFEGSYLSTFFPPSNSIFSPRGSW